MRIVIAGGGSVGFIVAEHFMLEGHDVTIIEQAESSVQLIQNRLDVNVVLGKATHGSTLEASQIKDADIFMSLTDDDDSNITACALAKIYGVPLKIARLNETSGLSEHSFVSLKNIGVDEIVDTEKSLVDEILEVVTYPGCANMETFMDGKYIVSVFSFDRKSKYFGQALEEIEVGCPISMLGISDLFGFRSYDAKLIINEFTYLYLACEKKYFDQVYKSFFPEKRKISKVMIFGQGYKSATANISLANRLILQGIQSTLVVDNKMVAIQLSQQTNFSIIYDDPAKPEFIKQKSLQDIDAYIALSNDFEKNIFSCISAYNEKVPYTVSLVRYPEHVNFMSIIPLTSFLNPAMATANQLMRYHRVDQFISRVIMRYNQSECLEFVVQNNKVLDHQIVKNLPFFTSKIIAIKRGQQFIEVTDETEILNKDRVLLWLINSEKQIFRDLIK